MSEAWGFQGSCFFNCSWIQVMSSLKWMDSWCNLWPPKKVSCVPHFDLLSPWHMTSWYVACFYCSYMTLICFGTKTSVWNICVLSESTKKILLSPSQLLCINLQIIFDDYIVESNVNWKYSILCVCVVSVLHFSFKLSESVSWWAHP